MIVHTACSLERRHQGMALGRRVRSLGLLGLWIAALPSAAAAAPAPGGERKLPSPASYGFYKDGHRIGTFKISYTRETFEGKPAIVEELDVTMMIVAHDKVENTQKTQTYVSLDNHLLFLREERSEGRAGGSMEARVLADRVECSIDLKGQKSKQTVPIPEGAVLTGGDYLQKLLHGNLRVGDKESSYGFDDTSLRVVRRVSQVVGREQVRTRDGALNAYVVQAGDAEKDLYSEEGHLLEVRIPSANARVVREDLEQPRETAAAPRDVMDAEAVPADRMISDPRHVYLLQLKVTGITDPARVLSDGRQRAVVAPDAPSTVVYQVRAAFPPEHGAPVVTAPSQDPALQDDAYLGINDPAIRKQAKEIAGGETDRAVIARRIHDWVQARITKFENVGTRRCAREIMENRDGVCREYATLFAALARAAGIPTRLCSGLMYTNGEFRWHAWNECRLTEDADGWYLFDATRDGDFVDATYVKNLQGDVAEMLGMGGALSSRVKVEVLSYR